MEEKIQIIKEYEAGKTKTQIGREKNMNEWSVCSILDENLEEIKSHLESESKMLKADDEESFEKLFDGMKILLKFEEKIQIEKTIRHKTL